MRRDSNSFWLVRELPDNYVYGQKKIFDNILVVYSNEYDPYYNSRGKVYNKTTGFALLMGNGEILNWVRIFDSQEFINNILISYSFDNYIIPVYIINEGMDLIVDAEVATTEYSFGVIEITEDGTMKFLPEQKGREIAKEYLSSDKLYKGRF